MYDEKLADRIRTIVQESPGVTERKMFGGLAFLDRGHMFCGIIDRDLMVRVGPEEYERALSMPDARELDFTGRPMRGMVLVAESGLRRDKALRDWVARGLRFTQSLSAKTAAAPRPRRTARTKR